MAIKTIRVCDKCMEAADDFVSIDGAAVSSMQNFDDPTITDIVGSLPGGVYCRDCVVDVLFPDMLLISSG